MQACNTGTCSAYIFQTSRWSVCTKTCGSGTSTRRVYCEPAGTGSEVPDSRCLFQSGTSASVKPDNIRSCNTLPCLGEGVASWVVDTVSPCMQGGVAAACAGASDRTITCRCGASVTAVGAAPSATVHHQLSFHCNMLGLLQHAVDL